MSHPQPHIQSLLEQRYFLRDENGVLLEDDPLQMYDRVAHAIALAEENNHDKWHGEFYILMKDNKFLPNTPTLINAGKQKPGSYSACFVLPVEDSMEGIFEAVKQAALISKAGGGLGFNFGHLREKGAIVSTTGHKSSGPISFMRVFNTMCDTISQGGVRRGALLGLLPIWHPDVEEFIACKDDGVSFTNFNISVGITDEFMRAVENNDDFILKSPKDGLVKYIGARNLWNKIVEHAWKTGDPGLFFLDTVNRAHPLDEDIECPNACGELPLRNFESCNLGSINLMAYIIETPCVPFPQAMSPCIFDYDALASDIPTMVRFLDDVIDVNPFPLPEIKPARKVVRLG
jgi:ribonucleoside-diphosphate reductase alpha chain